LVHTRLVTRGSDVEVGRDDEQMFASRPPARYLGRDERVFAPLRMYRGGMGGPHAAWAERDEKEQPWRRS